MGATVGGGDEQLHFSAPAIEMIEEFANETS